ncbi:TonB-dependent siderophore receptor [Paraglaciecola sp. L3A3]|uniref:TonB-dependent receptor n=1 Tax=Paraglaciecola sp. L3A3 TaxID=2686358 RepID=UPI00131BE13A|nr:TonB-dependent receptor [Paraglaciecola sp. L3A3]
MYLEKAKAVVCLTLSTYLLSSNAYSQENPLKVARDKTSDIESITVVGHAVSDIGLSEKSTTGSRLGLTILETPATIEIIDDAVMRARGYEKLSEAVESFPGIVTGDTPTAPSSFSMRGFSGAQITVLRDGLWVGPSTMVMRPQNTFNLQRVEILRGPSSVLNGVGAVAGTVNAVTKSARQNERDEMNILASYGKYNSYHLGVGAKGEINDSLWYNGTVSTYSSDGYVDDTDQSSSNFTLSLMWNITDDFSARFSTDHLQDKVGSYFGTPLVPLDAARDPLTSAVKTDSGETLDGAMRFKNYNIEDADASSEQYFNRVDLAWHISDTTSLQNTLYQFNAERNWKNAEGFVYCTEQVGVCEEVGTIQRYYGYFILDHDQDLWGNRFTLNNESKIAGMDNRFLAGFELIDLDFLRTRGFRRSVPIQAEDAVDPYNPVAGFYGQEELRGASPTQMKTQAIFAEDAVELNSDLSLVLALRYEELDLDRENYNAEGINENSGFSRTYSWASWRLGTVYKFTDELVAYAHYNNAKDPIGSNIFLVNANQNFDLTDAVQWEVGMKSTLLDDRAELTLAYFDIERDDVLESFSVDSATNIGGRDSSGVEVSFSMKPTDNWRLGLNSAYTNASFKPSSNFVDFADNTPPNIPEWTANAWLSYSNIASLPIEAGISWHYVGDRFGDNENSVTLKNYALTDVFANWTFNNYRISAKVDNLFDEVYVPWSQVSYLHNDDPSFIYANQLNIGAPRTFRVSFEATF